MSNVRFSPLALRRAFTLIELMVVLLIIALLASILIPSVTEARKAAKTAQSKVLINTLEQGVHSFKSDEWLGNVYPPSLWPPGVGTSPDADSNPYGVAKTGWGAQTLVWAVVGAKLTGTRKFVPELRDAYNNEDLARGPFVDPSKLEIVRPDDEKCALWGDEDGPPPVVYTESPVILDSFGMPVLYYLPDRNPGLTEIRDMLCLEHNMPFTGKGSYVDNSRLWHEDYFNEWFKDTRTAAFGAVRPHNYDTFVLLSGGADKIYGTMDDPANFKLNTLAP